MGDYERGVLDGFELALYLHRRHLDEIPADRGKASAALGRFRREASLTLDALRVHRLRAVALFFGFDDVWTPERAARLYALVSDADADAAESPAVVPQNAIRGFAVEKATEDARPQKA